MQMPSTSLEIDIVFEELVQEFPPEIEKLAREFKAFARTRKIKTVAQLLRIVLLYCGLDKSLRDVAANVTMTIEQISDTAIAKRLIAANAWVKAMLPLMINLPKIDQAGHKRIIVVDGSCVQGPGAKGTQYRFHIALNLLTLEIVELIAGDRTKSESLTNFHFQAGDIVIGDRAYGQRRQKLIDARRQGYDFLLRCHSELPLINAATGEEIDLIKQLAGKSEIGQYCMAVEIKSEKGDEVVSGWLHAFKLPAAAAAKAQRKIKAEAKKKKRKTKALTLFLAGWLVVFTTLSQLYRCRWQVEVAIKRLKSLLDADLLRTHFGSPLAQVWLNGKMLYVLMIERRTKRKCKYGADIFSLSSNRALTDWRLWKMIEDEVAPLITLVQFWPSQFPASVLRALAERPRRRKLQSLPGDLSIFLSPLNKPLNPAIMAA
jgi:hypothetical protein